MIVLAVFWPHVKPRIYLATKKLLSSVSKPFRIDDGHKSNISEIRNKNLNSAYPKLISKRLNRLVSSKEVKCRDKIFDVFIERLHNDQSEIKKIRYYTIINIDNLLFLLFLPLPLSLPLSLSLKTPLRSLHRSVEGFSQSRITQKQEPSFASGGASLIASSSSSEQLDHLARGQHIPGTNLNYRQQEQQSSTLLSIYTACIIVLVIYTMMKALGARLNGGTLDQNTFINHSSRSKQDTKSSLDKRKLARMSREERIRELIRQHGGKNVSTAIKFLATELEKEKKSLVKNLSQAGMFRCLCNCHHSGSTGNNNLGRENFEENPQSCKIEDNQMRDEAPTTNTHKGGDQSMPKLSEQANYQQPIIRERKKPTEEVSKNK